MSNGSVLPVVRYTNPAAADWLCTAYGFSIHHVAERPGGGTAYTVLRFGADSSLDGPHASSNFDDLIVQPADVGNRSTETCYLTVEDVDQHFAHAQAAGARVEVEPRDDGDGGRFYMSRDPGGHLWSFGNAPAGATLAGPDRPFEGLRLSPAKGSRAVVGLAMLFSLTVVSTALNPNAADAAAGQPVRERLTTIATTRLAEGEAVGVDMTEKQQTSQLQFAQELQQKQSADKPLSAPETEDPNRLKETQDALAAALRAKEVASQELEAERLRSLVIQQQLDEASEKLASQRTDGSKVDTEALQLRAAMAQLSDALLNSTRAADAARGQLATVQITEKALRERLRASARETAELRARVSELEAEQEAARAQTKQAADAARTALAAARANAVRPRDRPRAGEHGTADVPASVTATETKKEAARLRTEQDAEANRVRQAASAAAAEEDRQRLAAEAAQKAEAERQRQAAEAAQKAEAERQRQAAEAVAAARRVEEDRQRLAAEAAQKAEAERQRQAAEAVTAARKVEEDRQRLAAEAAQKAEAERQRQAAEAVAAARKVEEDRQRLAAEVAQKAEAERQRERHDAEAAEAARKAEEERQRLAAEASQKADAERQQLAIAEAARIAKEAAEAKARADQETRRRTLGLTVTPEDGARYLARGRALLTTGDVTSARLFLERASNAGLADAAMELAETYDPATVTKRPNVVGLAADREQARVWYMRAQVLGSAAAAERLKSMGGQ